LTAQPVRVETVDRGLLLGAELSADAAGRRGEGDLGIRVLGREVVAASPGRSGGDRPEHEHGDRRADDGSPS